MNLVSSPQKSCFYIRNGVLYFNSNNSHEKTNNVKTRCRRVSVVKSIKMRVSCLSYLFKTPALINQLGLLGLRRAN